MRIQKLRVAVPAGITTLCPKVAVSGAGMPPNQAQMRPVRGGEAPPPVPQEALSHNGVPKLVEVCGLFQIVLGIPPVSNPPSRMMSVEEPHGVAVAVAVGLAVAVAVAVGVDVGVEVGVAVGVAVGVDVGVAVAVAVAVGVETGVAVAVAVAVGVDVGVDVAVAVAVGVGDAVAVTSSAPISGVVAERGSLSKSLVTETIGVAIFATGDESETRCRSTVAALPVGLTRSGLTETEFASWPVAACQFAKVC